MLDGVKGNFVVDGSGLVGPLLPVVVGPVLLLVDCDVVVGILVGVVEP